MLARLVSRKKKKKERHHSPNSRGEEAPRGSDCGCANLHTLVFTAATFSPYTLTVASAWKVKKQRRSSQSAEAVRASRRRPNAPALHLLLVHRRCQVCRVAGGCWDGVWRFWAGGETTLPAGGRSEPGAAWVGRRRAPRRWKGCLVTAG